MGMGMGIIYYEYEYHTIKNDENKCPMPLRTLYLQIKKPISLVQNQKLQIIQIHPGRISQMINQTPRSRHNHIRPSPQFRRLGIDILGPTHHKRRPQRREFRHGRHHSETLRCQFPRGGEDEAAGGGNGGGFFGG